MQRRYTNQVQFGYGMCAKALKVQFCSEIFVVDCSLPNVVNTGSKTAKIWLSMLFLLAVLGLHGIVPSSSFIALYSS